MDNASKALIMAGAILIAVALVGVGVYMYSNAAGQVDNATTQLSAAEVQMRNSEFEIYEGTIKGTEAKSLIRKVLAFNAENVFPNGITLTGITTVAGITSNSNTYVITLTYNETAGQPRYITQINIAAQTGTAGGTTTP